MSVPETSHGPVKAKPEVTTLPRCCPGELLAASQHWDVEAPPRNPFLVEYPVVDSLRRLETAR